MNDLKIIDELLCMSKRPGQSWSDLEHCGFNIHRIAIQRLREAWSNGELEYITLGLSKYFEEPTDA